MSRYRVGLIVVLGCATLFAQDRQLSFEAASIKPAIPIVGPFLPGSRRVCPLTGCGGPGTGDPGRITFTTISLKNLIVAAYGIRPYQIDAPAWLDSSLFDVVATIPAGATRDDVNLMLQNLLAERFGLKVHRSTKELPVYALTVAKGGPLLKETVSNPAAPAGAKGRGTIFTTTPDGPRKQFEFDGMTLAAFADVLAPEVDRPVIDKTGLTAKYDLRLEFAPERNIPFGPSASSASAPAGGSTPALFTALTEQLGLRLESGRGPVTVLVVDSALKEPTGN
jgi:uncharacterized protein (TIGR03435 family)